MKSKIVSWFSRNRKPIGYTIGALNIMTGISDIAMGNYMFGIFWLTLASVIIYDARTTNESH